MKKSRRLLRPVLWAAAAAVFTPMAAAQCATPTNLVASDGTACGSVLLTWQHNGLGAPTGFRIRRATSNNILAAAQVGTSTSKSFSDSTVVAGTTYWYWVNPTGGGCGANGPDSASDSGFRAVTPSAPTGLNAEFGDSCAHVTVTWNSVPGATGYDVGRSTINLSSSASVIGSPAITSFIDSSAVPGVVYYYFVRSSNATCTGAYGSSHNGMRASSPSAPINVVASDGESCAVRVTWDFTGAPSHEVWRNTVNDVGSATLIGTTTGTEWDDADSAPEQVNYYWVQAVNQCGGGTFSAPDTGYKSEGGRWVTGFAQPGLNAGANGVFALTPASGGNLFVAGSFMSAGGVANTKHVARWDGSAWSALGFGLDSFGFGAALTSGGDLIVGGNFLNAGGVPAAHIARWNGSAWSPLGDGLNDVVYKVLVGSNGDVIAGGSFVLGDSNVAYFRAGVWAPLGTYVGVVRSMIPTPDGDLVAGSAFGGPVSKWNGTVWSPLGPDFSDSVYALAFLPNGDLIAGGSFTDIGATHAPCIARWDGTQWHPLNGELNNTVVSLQVLPNGDILAGGFFTSIDNVAVYRLARYDGAAWHALGAGVDNGVPVGGDHYVGALAQLPGGDVAVGGKFLDAGGAAASCIARWTPAVASAITQQPVTQQVCTTGAGSFSIAVAPGAPVAYRWQYKGGPASIADWVDLVPGANDFESQFMLTAAGVMSDSLGVSRAPQWDPTGPSFEFRCVASVECGEVASDAATLRVCAADLDCSGEVDLNDFFEFLNCFDQTLACADVDGSGEEDLNDFFLFLNAFDQSC